MIVKYRFEAYKMNRAFERSIAANDFIRQWRRLAYRVYVR